MIKRIVFFSLLVLLLTIKAFGTDVQIAATTVPFAQISGLPADVTGTASVTSGSNSVTIVTNFRTSWINQSGFLINLPAGDYYVASVASGGAITLTTPYTGPTAASVSYRVYPFVYLRFYANMSYTPNGKGYVVQGGVPGSSQFFLQKSATVRNNQVFLPVIILDATTDAVNPAERAARLGAFFYRQDGSQIGVYQNFGSFQLRPESPSSWTAISAYNAAGQIAPPDDRYYLVTQIDSFLPVCQPGQMAYYPAPGRQMTCLTVGSGLNISGGVITASGGGGGGPAAWSALTAPTADLSLNHGAYATLMQWGANTGSANLFALETATNDIGSNALLQLSTPGGGNTKSPLRVSARGANSLIVNSSGKVGLNQISPVAQLDIVPDSTGTVGVKVNAPAGYTSYLLQTQVSGVLGPFLMAGAGGRVDSVFGSAGSDLTPGSASGFLHVPASSGPPTGAPAIYPGTVALTFDRVNNRLYVYDSGWLNMTGGGGGGGGGGSSVWSALTDPTTSLGLNMGANPTTFSWNSASGSSDLFTLRNTSGDTGSNYLLRVQAHGSKQPLLVQADTTNALRVAENGRTIFGAVDAATTLPFLTTTVITGQGATAGATLYSASNSTLDGSRLQLARSRGTLDTATAVSTGDTLGSISFTGRDGGVGGGYAGNAFIAGEVDGTVSSGTVPTRISFVGAAGAGTWMTMKSSGLIGITTINPASQLHVLGASSSTIGLIVEQPSAPTVDVFQGRVNGAVKFRFAPDSTTGVYDYVFGDQVLPASASRGFVYLPTVTSGAPSGTPASYPGVAPLVLRNESGNTKIYAFLDNNWVDLSSGGGGGSSVWSSLTNPIAPLSLSMAAHTTTFTWGGTTGTGTNLFTIANGSSDTGTGYLLDVSTPGGGNSKGPFRVRARGIDALLMSPTGMSSFGVATTLGRVTVGLGASGIGEPMVGTHSTVTATGSGNLSAQPFLAGVKGLLVDQMTGAGTRAFGAGVIGRYERSVGANAIIALSAGLAAEFVLSETSSDAGYGIYVNGPAVASGKSLASFTGLRIDAPSGPGTTSLAQAIFTQSGAGASGFGVMPSQGMVHILSNANATRGLYVDTPTGATADTAAFAFGGTLGFRLVPGLGLNTASASVRVLNAVFGATTLNEDTTNGFVYITATDIAPTANPTTFTGTVPLVYDLAGNRLWGFNGSWVNLTAGGAGSSVWSALTNPSAPLSLTMGNNSSTFTSGTATGAVSPIWNYLDGTNDSGTGYFFSIETPGVANSKSPFRVRARGQENFTIDSLGRVGFGIANPTNWVEASYSFATNIVRDAIHSSVTLAGSTGALSPTDVTAVMGVAVESRTGTSTGGMPRGGFFEYVKTAGSRSDASFGANGTALVVGARVDESIFGNVYGIYINAPTVASGKSVFGNLMGLYIDGASLAGTASNRYAILTAQDAGSVFIGQAGTPSDVRLQVTGGLAAEHVARFNAADGLKEVQFQSVGTTVFRFVAAAGPRMNAVFGNGVLPSTATNGYVYLPTMTDQPPGTTVPTAYTGMAPIMIENDATNSQYLLWAYVNGNWRNLTGTGASGSTAWSALTNPGSNLSLNHGLSTTTMTWNNTSGSANMWTFTNSTDNAGSGYLVSIETPGANNQTFPFRVVTGGLTRVEVDPIGNIEFNPTNGVTIDATGNGDGLTITNGGVAGVALNVSQFTGEPAFRLRANAATGSSTAQVAEYWVSSNGTPAAGLRNESRWLANSTLGIPVDMGRESFAWKDATNGTQKAIYRLTTASGESNTSGGAVLADRLVITPRTLLTDNSPTEILRAPVGVGQALALQLTFTAIARGSTTGDIQIYSSTVIFQAWNNGSILPTNAVIVIGGQGSATSGSMSCTFSGTDDGTNAILRANCNSDFSTPTIMAYTTISNNSPRLLTLP